eukprot:symbB.v1.2.011710.t1/scaffold790.1/size295610/2
MRFLHERQCIEDCPDGHFGEKDSNICLPCHDSCATCNAPKENDCQSCPSTYALHEGKCMSACPANYFADLNSVCQPLSGAVIALKTGGLGQAYLVTSNQTECVQLVPLESEEFSDPSKFIRDEATLVELHPVRCLNTLLITFFEQQPTTGMRSWCLPCAPRQSSNVKVTLDVGGHRYTSTFRTLATGRAARSALADLVNGPCEEDGSYFLDRDGLQFLFIMNYLRNGPETFVPPDTRTARLTLAVEAKMLRLYELADLLEKVVTPMPSPLPSRLTYALGEGDTYFGAPIPKNEVERIAKLRSLEVLDTQNTAPRMIQVQLVAGHRDSGGPAG